MDFDKATEMIDRLTSHERQLINCYTIYTTRPSSYHDNSLNSEKCAIQGSQNVILKFFLEWQVEWYQTSLEKKFPNSNSACIYYTISLFLPHCKSVAGVQTLKLLMYLAEFQPDTCLLTGDS